MSKDKHASADQQVGEFKYRDDKAWELIQRLFAELGINADTHIFKQKCGSESLRDWLERLAQYYQLRDDFYPRCTKSQLRKGFQHALAAACEARLGYEKIVRSRVLWTDLSDDSDTHMASLKLAQWLEDDVLPGMLAVEIRLRRQLEKVGPYHPAEAGHNAAKPAQDEYVRELLELWDQVPADPKMKDRLRAQFLRVVTTPVLGPASPDRERSWLRRIDGGKT